MEEIGGKWSSLTREQQVYLAQTMAGQRQYSNLVALFDNFDQYEKTLKVAQDAAGTLEEQNEIVLESLRSHLNQLKASVEGLFQELSDTGAFEGVIDALSVIADLSKNIVRSWGGGVNVLKMLTGLGLSTFGTNIAKSIGTSITNFRTKAHQETALRTSIE
jgi:TP901 family phage tail tape measure protein